MPSIWSRCWSFSRPLSRGVKSAPRLVAGTGSDTFICSSSPRPSAASRPLQHSDRASGAQAGQPLINEGKEVENSSASPQGPRRFKLRTHEKAHPRTHRSRPARTSVTRMRRCSPKDPRAVRPRRLRCLHPLLLRFRSAIAHPDGQQIIPPFRMPGRRAGARRRRL